MTYLQTESIGDRRVMGMDTDALRLLRLGFQQVTRCTHGTMSGELGGRSTSPAAPRALAPDRSRTIARRCCALRGGRCGGRCRGGCSSGNLTRCCQTKPRRRGPIARQASSSTPDTGNRGAGLPAGRGATGSSRPGPADSHRRTRGVGSGSPKSRGRNPGNGTRDPWTGGKTGRPRKLGSTGGARTRRRGSG